MTDHQEACKWFEFHCREVRRASLRLAGLRATRPGGDDPDREDHERAIRYAHSDLTRHTREAKAWLVARIATAAVDAGVVDVAHPRDLEASNFARIAEGA